MNERRKIIFIFSATLCFLTFFISIGSIAFLYKTSVNEQKNRLLDMVLSQARLLEAVINSAQTTSHPQSQNINDSEALDFTLALFQQSIAAPVSGDKPNNSPPGDMGKTKSSLQFILARVENGTVYFLNSTGKNMLPTPLKDLQHKPIGKSLSGETGTRQLIDHLGVPVIVGYTPIAHSNWGLVAKIAITDLQSAYIQTSFLVWGVAVLMLITGIFVLLKIINPLLAQIVQSRDEARRANRSKSAFLANMSHEIRTPMNGIMGACRLALDEQTSPQMRYYLETIAMSSQNLLQLINDILDFSKIEADKLKLEKRPFNLHKTVDHAIRTVSLLAEEKNLTISSHIDADVPEAARGDSLRLLQIILNLLSNAVKFSDHGEITIHVKKMQEKEDQFELQFTVQDNGTGISPEKINHIFDSFEQEDSSTTRKYGGTGLGLAICRKLCQLMDGDIHAESVPGKGSTFVFSAVFQKSDLTEIDFPEHAKNKEDFHLPSLRILLVEDVLINRKLARMILTRDGHIVIEAQNGLDALKKLVAYSFDAILMDIQMPEMDGYTATRIIRALEKGNKVTETFPLELADKLTERLRGKHTPIIALTAHAISGDRDECLNSGMDDYLTKPFAPESVSRTLKNIINLGATSVHPQTQPDSLVSRKSQTKQNDSEEKVLSMLREKFPFTEEKLLQLLETSKQTIDQHLLKLEEAISKGDSEQIFTVTHSLHGTLLNLGLDDAAKISQKLVSASRNKEIAPYDEWFMELKEKLAGYLS
ncbi:MAG: response regulator [Desulfobulbaceae bacterium]|nr:response regulator [Desulfobulbaceae bacterium]